VGARRLLAPWLPEVRRSTEPGRPSMAITTANRVVRNTPPAVTQRILKRTESRLEYYERHPNEIPARLRELDREWDVERTLETGSASLTLLGLILGTTVNKK